MGLSFHNLGKPCGVSAPLQLPDVPYASPIPLGAKRQPHDWPQVNFSRFSPVAGRLLADSLSMIESGLRGIDTTLHGQLGRTNIIPLTAQEFPGIDIRTALAAWNWESRLLGVNERELLRIGNPFLVGSVVMHELSHVVNQPGPGRNLRETFINETNAHTRTSYVLNRFSESAHLWSPQSPTDATVWSHQFRRLGLKAQVDAATYNVLGGVYQIAIGLSRSGVLRDPSPAVKVFAQNVTTCLRYGELTVDVIRNAIEDIRTAIIERRLEPQIQSTTALRDLIESSYEGLRLAEDAFAACPPKCVF